MPYMVPAKRVEETEQVAHPEPYCHDDHDIQYRFDGPLHGNEAVYKPEQHAHDDECKDNIDKWQEMLLSSDRGRMGPAGFSSAGLGRVAHSTWFGLLRLGDGAGVSSL